MDDLQIEFDFLVGKNEVNSAIDGIKNSAKAAGAATDGLSSSIKKTADETTKAAKEQTKYYDATKVSTKSSTGFYTELASSVAIYSAAITAAVYSAKEFIGSAIEAEESVSNLEVALKQTGIFSESTSQKFQELAASIQKTTVYSDDQALSLVATLQNIGQFTEEGLLKATKASIELASAFKLDLSSAAALVGKAATGNTVALQKMGIEVRKGKTDAETFANTLEALARFEGDSAEKATTLGGSLKSLGNSFGELFETVSVGTSDFLNLKSIFVSLKDSINRVNENLKSNLFLGLGSAIKEILLTLPVQLGEAIGNAIRESIGLSVKDSVSNAKRIIDQEKVTSKDPSLSAIFDISQNNLAPKAPSKMIGDIAEASKTSAALLRKRKGDEEELRKEQQKTVDALRKEYLSLYEQIKDAGISQEQAILDAATRNFNKVEDLRSKGAFKSKAEYEEAVLLVEKDLNDKLKKLDEDRINSALELQKKSAAILDKDAEESRKKLLASFNLASGFVSNALSGKEGARQAISSGAGAIGEALLPGSGPAISAIASQLTQGPEATRAMVKEFAAAVPELIVALVEAVPVLIEELSNQFPRVVQVMADALGDPSFWVNFGKGLLKATVASVIAIPKAFISAIPEFFDGFGKQLINAIIDGFSQAINLITEQLNPFDGGGGGLLGLGFLGLARGGSVQSVPNGFPNDTFPAMLSSGELVVDRSTVERLNSFMDGQGAPQAGLSDALLSQILNKLSEPQNVSSSVTLNGREFANIILELNRSRVRLA